MTLWPLMLTVILGILAGSYVFARTMDWFYIDQKPRGHETETIELLPREWFQ